MLRFNRLKSTAPMGSKPPLCRENQTINIGNLYCLGAFEGFGVEYFHDSIMRDSHKSPSAIDRHRRFGKEWQRILPKWLEP